METPDSLTAAMGKIISHFQAQYGEAVKAYWFYAEDTCPCCAKREIGLLKVKHEYAVSLNAFLYNEMSVLIGYSLCRICVMDLFKASKKRQAIMHQRIEKHLVEAYHRYLALAN